jgi:hypothetical protein
MRVVLLLLHLLALTACADDMLFIPSPPTAHAGNVVASHPEHPEQATAPQR